MDSALNCLRVYWGYENFRGIQKDIVESVIAGHDTLGLMPTGGGKSITFQVPALVVPGLCVVITPLIALMVDQVANLRARGIRATALYSGLSREEFDLRIDNCVLGGIDLLYIAPERLGSPEFIVKLKQMNVGLIAVDEAHCISQWGYDFRPSYLEIAAVRDYFPNVPVLALTATATPQVAADIQEKLHFRPGSNFFKMSFERKNLAYVVRRTEDKERELVHILRSVGGSAIVYTRSREKTEYLSRLLNDEGITAQFFHAGLARADKDFRLEAWKNDVVRVMAATNAFGMGIDKPDVRLVVHADLPDSLEAYFQEAGRAGRDGKKAYAVLLYNPGDRTKMLRRVGENYPPIDFLREVYDDVCYFLQVAIGDAYGRRYEFDFEQFCQNFKHFPVRTESALQLLTRAGYIQYEASDESRSRAMFLVDRDELYRYEAPNAAVSAVLSSLLRSYGGLFSSYVYIEERQIALRTGLAETAVYDALIQLSRHRIVAYIPRRNIPHIVFTTRRLDGKQLQFPPAVYADRRADLERRIGQMLHYAESTDICRSRQLLEYFGEKGAKDCGQCDVCVEAAKTAASQEGAEAAVASRLLRLFADGKPRSATDLRIDGVPTDTVARALRRLVSEERLRLEDGRFRPEK